MPKKTIAPKVPHPWDDYKPSLEAVGQAKRLHVQKGEPLKTGKPKFNDNHFFSVTKKLPEWEEWKQKQALKNEYVSKASYEEINKIPSDISMKLIFLDTETTGVKNARMVQLAYSLFASEEVYCQIFKPTSDMEIGAMATHHITPDMYRNRPFFQNTPDKNVLQGLLNENVCIAHNASFDLSILQNEGVTAKWHICTYKIANYLYDLESYKLQYLRYYFKFYKIKGEAHSADGDVLVLKEVFFKILQDFSEQFKDLDQKQVIQKMVEISRKPMLLRRPHFGKHEGLTYEQISVKDPGWLRWLLGKEAEKGDQGNQDLIYTLKHYLNINF